MNTVFFLNEKITLFSRLIKLKPSKDTKFKYRNPLPTKAGLIGEVKNPDTKTNLGVFRIFK